MTMTRLLLCTLLTAGAAAQAAEATPVACDACAKNKSAYTLLNPTPVSLMREMSTDRPDTTESPITVDAGHFQIETSLIDFNRDKSAGVTTKTWTFASVNIKAGLLNNTDIQFVLDSHVESKTSVPGASTTANGISDLTIRLKQNLWGNDGGTKTSFALMPWISAPTGSSDLRSEKYQGGLIAPLGFDLAEGVSAAVMLQADALWDDGTKSYYMQWTHSATCGFEITDKLGAFVEYVGEHRSGSRSEYTMYGNTGLTYAISDNLVADLGVRIGLNSRADDFGGFIGMSYRH